MDRRFRYYVDIAAPVARSGEGAWAQVYNLQRCRWNRSGHGKNPSVSNPITERCWGL